ncbi:hypothetical protein Tco_0178966 [Tanacetum coccineum]
MKADVDLEKEEDQEDDEEFGDNIVNVTMVDEEVDSNPTRDIEELERLLAKDPHHTGYAQVVVLGYKTSCKEASQTRLVGCYTGGLYHVEFGKSNTCGLLHGLGQACVVLSPFLDQTMSSPDHPTANLEDAFSSNFLNYVPPASPDYVPAHPGKILTLSIF